jgi:hypothetical protein
MGGSGNLRWGFPVVDAVDVGAVGAVDGTEAGTVEVACANNRPNIASILFKALVDASSTFPEGGTADPDGPAFASLR